MAWFRLDDSWLTHPKHRAAGKDGRSLFVASGTHCAQQLTDGVIDKGSVAVIAALAEVKPTVAKKLVEVGLWEEHDDHFVLHDFLEYNRSRDEVMADRDRWKRNKKRQRSSTVESTRVSTEDTHEESTAESSLPRPDPTRGELKVVHPPPVCTTADPAGGGGLSIATQALSNLAELELIEAESNGANIVTRARFRQGILNRLKRERSTEAHALIHDNPGASPDEIARLMHSHLPAVATVPLEDSSVVAGALKDRSCPECLGSNMVPTDPDDTSSDLIPCPTCGP